MRHCRGGCRERRKRSKDSASCLFVQHRLAFAAVVGGGICILDVLKRRYLSSSNSF